MFKNYRSFICLMLFFAMLINYLDRSALSVAMPILAKDFGLTKIEMGWVFSSFFAGYALFNLVGGYLSDKYGAHPILAGSMVIWSLFCGMTTLATGVTSLLLIRFFFGVGEGPISASSNKIVYNWFPPGERAKVFSYALAGVPLGGAVAGPIVGMMTSYWGWKVAFWVLVAIGVIWTVIFMKKVAERPQDSPYITAEELKLIEASQAAQAPVVAGGTDTDNLSAWYFIRKPIVLTAAFGYFVHSYVMFFFLSWFPSYLMLERGLSLKEMSFATVVPWLVGTFGFIFAGHIADMVLKKTNDVYFTRRWVSVVCTIIVVGCVGMAGVVQTTAAALILTGISLFCSYVAIPQFWGIIQENVTGKRMGVVGGFVHFVANSSGIIAPAVTGYAVTASGKFISSFYLAAVIVFVGAIALYLFVKKPVEAAEV